MPPVGFEPTISAGERPAAAHLSIRKVGRNWISNLSFKDSIAYVIPSAFAVICDEHKTVPFVLSSPFLGSCHFLPYPENVFAKVLHIVFALPCLQTPNHSEHAIT